MEDINAINFLELTLMPTKVLISTDQGTWIPTKGVFILIICVDNIIPQGVGCQNSGCLPSRKVAT